MNLPPMKQGRPDPITGGRLTHNKEPRTRDELLPRFRLVEGDIKPVHFAHPVRETTQDAAHDSAGVSRRGAWSFQRDINCDELGSSLLNSSLNLARLLSIPMQPGSFSSRLSMTERFAPSVVRR